MKKTLTARRRRWRLSCAAGRSYCIVCPPLSYLPPLCITFWCFCTPPAALRLSAAVLAQHRYYFSEDRRVVSECLWYGWCTTEKYRREPVLLCKGDFLNLRSVLLLLQFLSLFITMTPLEKKYKSIYYWNVSCVSVFVSPVNAGSCTHNTLMAGLGPHSLVFTKGSCRFTSSVLYYFNVSVLGSYWV